MPAEIPAEPGLPGATTLRQALGHDFARASLRQWLLLAAAVAWLVYEWGPGNETVTPWILANILDDNPGSNSIYLLPIVGFLFTAVQQTMSGFTALAALSTFTSSAEVLFHRVAAGGVEGLGLTRVWKDRNIRERVFIGFMLGSTAVAVGEVVLGGSKVNKAAARRAVAASAVYTGLAVAVIAAVVAFLTWLGRSYERTAGGTEQVISLLSSPWPWLVVATVVMVRWVLEFRRSGDV